MVKTGLDDAADEGPIASGIKTALAGVKVWSRNPVMTQKRAQPIVDPRMLRVLGFEDLHLGMRESLMKAVMDTDVVGFALPFEFCCSRSIFFSHRRLPSRFC